MILYTNKLLFIARQLHTYVSRGCPFDLNAMLLSLTVGERAWSVSIRDQTISFRQGNHPLSGFLSSWADRKLRKTPSFLFPSALRKLLSLKVGANRWHHLSRLRAELVFVQVFSRTSPKKTPRELWHAIKIRTDVTFG